MESQIGVKFQEGGMEQTLTPGQYSIISSIHWNEELASLERGDTVIEMNLGFNIL